MSNNRQVYFTDASGNSGFTVTQNPANQPRDTSHISGVRTCCDKEVVGCCKVWHLTLVSAFLCAISGGFCCLCGGSSVSNGVAAKVILETVVSQPTTAATIGAIL